MFDFIWNIFKGEDPKVVTVKNFLRTIIIRNRYLRKREAIIKLQSAFRYYKLKKDIKRRLRREGVIIIDKQFLLKKRWLMKLKGELFEYISYVDKRLDSL